ALAPDKSLDEPSRALDAQPDHGRRELLLQRLHDRIERLSRQVREPLFERAPRPLDALLEILRRRRARAPLGRTVLLDPPCLLLPQLLRKARMVEDRLLEAGREMDLHGVVFWKLCE